MNRHEEAIVVLVTAVGERGSGRGHVNDEPVPGRDGNMPAMDAVRVLAHAALAVEEGREDNDFCLSMLVGESGCRTWTGPLMCRT